MPDKVIVLTEGKADDEFIRQLISNRGIEGFEIYEPQLLPSECEEREAYGFTNFELRLRNLRIGTYLDARQYKAILIVADNDEEPAKRFSEIAEQISAAEGYAVPSKPRELSARGEYPPVAILMLPWDNAPGCLETLLLESARNHVPEIAQCVEGFLSCAKCTEENDWNMVKGSKLELRCLLGASCKDNPTIGIFLAWTSANTRNAKDGKLIPLEHPCFNQIEGYMRSFS